MDKHYKQMTDFLVGMGIDELPHTHKSYLAHLIAVFRDLDSLGSRRMCAAPGCFIRSMGRRSFRGSSCRWSDATKCGPLIGDRAERLAYLNCAMDRAAFDRALETADGPFQIGDRITGETIEVSGADFDDLCRVHLIDWLEQVPRSEEWDYRRAGYQKMARRLGGGRNKFERVYGRGEIAIRS